MPKWQVIIIAAADRPHASAPQLLCRDYAQKRSFCILLNSERSALSSCGLATLQLIIGELSSINVGDVRAHRRRNLTASHVAQPISFDCEAGFFIHFFGGDFPRRRARSR